MYFKNDLFCIVYDLLLLFIWSYVRFRWCCKFSVLLLIITRMWCDVKVKKKKYATCKKYSYGMPEKINSSIMLNIFIQCFVAISLMNFNPIDGLSSCRCCNFTYLLLLRYRRFCWVSLLFLLFSLLRCVCACVCIRNVLSRCNQLVYCYTLCTYLMPSSLVSSLLLMIDCSSMGDLYSSGAWFCVVACRKSAKIPRNFIVRFLFNTVFLHALNVASTHWTTWFKFNVVSPCYF